VQFVNLMVQAATAAQMPEVAILTLEIAKEHCPQDVQMMRNLARRYQDANRMHDARVIYEEIVRLKPADPQAIKDLKDSSALDSMQRGGWSEASSYRDIMKDTKEATRLEQAAKAVKTGRDVDDLVAETRAKIEREPQNVNYKRSLAELFTKADRHDEALAVLAEAQQQTGGADPQIDRMIGEVRKKQYEERIAALEASGDSAAAAEVRKEKDTFFLSDAEDKVRRYPNDLQFKFDLGTLYFERGMINEAIQQLQLAQRNPQRRIRALYYLALCFKQKKQFDIAREQLEKANSELNLMDETKKDILYELGSVCENMNQPDKAVEFFKEIYSVDIGYRDVTQKIEKFYKR
jgi:tetratricopeptide (TPR) repeat protein